MEIAGGKNRQVSAGRDFINSNGERNCTQYHHVIYNHIKNIVPLLVAVVFFSLTANVVALIGAYRMVSVQHEFQEISKEHLLHRQENHDRIMAQMQHNFEIDQAFSPAEHARVMEMMTAFAEKIKEDTEHIVGERCGS